MSNLWKEGLSVNKPRWIILLLDMIIVATAFFISYVLIFKHRGGAQPDEMIRQALLVSLVYLIWFCIFGTYKGVVHKTGIRELQRIVLAIGLAYFSSVLICKAIEWLYPYYEAILPFSDTQLLFHALIAGFGMTFSRVLYRSLYHQLMWGDKDNRIPVILFGAGNMGNTTFHFIHTTSRNKYRIVAIMDDNPHRIGNRIQGFKIHDINVLNKDFVSRHGNASEIIIAVDDRKPERLNTDPVNC